MLSPVPQTVRLARRITKGVARRLDALGQRLGSLEEKVSPDARDTAPLSHDQAVVRLMNQYNMVTHPDEPYYADQYLRFILPELERRFPDRRTVIFDLGCGQGRHSLPLARWCAESGGSVTGVDLTPAAIELARQYASDQSLRNVTFIAGDALEFVRGAANHSADAVLFAEVAIIMPTYREVLRELGRVLRPGGIAFIGFRSQYYNLLQFAWLRHWESAKRCLNERNGNIFSGTHLPIESQMWFGWHTLEEIRPLLSSFGLNVLRTYGIGVLSGTVGDARGTIVHPGLLTAEDQHRLMEIECAAAEQYAACGRFIFAVAEPAGAADPAAREADR
jgi:2-polyprenyl-3-methyl-5-hydroxy-6-metoxy-1,4-benzoquinol methylase